MLLRVPSLYVAIILRSIRFTEGYFVPIFNSLPASMPACPLALQFSAILIDGKECKWMRKRPAEDGQAQQHFGDGIRREGPGPSSSSLSSFPSSAS